MIDWKRKTMQERQKRPIANVHLVEFEVGSAVAIPANLPIDQINQLAQAQYEKMKGAQ